MTNRVFRISFEITKKPGDRYWSAKEYRDKIVICESLGKLISDGPKQLMEIFPREEGSGGSHYSTEPVYGDCLTFTKIEELFTNVTTIK